jgi:hypothetical protein
MHESVTGDRLTETKIGFKRYRVSDDPIYRRLYQNEQPHFLFHADKQTPLINGPAASEGIERSRGYKIMHLISDVRWLMIAGNRSGDQTHEVLLEEIKATNYETEGMISDRLSNNIFAFEVEGAHYTIPLSNDFTGEDLDDLSRYLRDEAGAVRGGTEVDSDAAGFTIAGNDSIEYTASDVRSRVDRLPESALDEADELVAQTNDVEELIPRLDTLIEQYSKPSRSLNDVVIDSSSVEELRREVETPSERAQRRASEHAAQGIESVKKTLDEADPEEVGEWGLNVGKAGLPLAIAASGPTTLWVAALLATGSAAGVHASGVKNSPLAEIDPSELAQHADAMSTVGAELDHINGESVGALLGAFYYLGGQLAPEEYAKWFVKADPEAILAGADAGAAFANRSEGKDNRRQGAVAGAGLGLLGGYAGDEFDAEEFRDTLDSDIYKEYLEIHAQNGIELPD